MTFSDGSVFPVYITFAGAGRVRFHLVRDP